MLRIRTKANLMRKRFLSGLKVICNNSACRPEFFYEEAGSRAQRTADKLPACSFECLIGGPPATRLNCWVSLNRKLVLWALPS